jgi:polyisoprenoid-binding protein YceI
MDDGTPVAFQTGVRNVHSRREVHHDAAFSHPVFLTSVFAFAIAISTSLVAQDAVRTPLALNSARVSIAGTSNIHAYTASTTTGRLTRVQVASIATGANFWDEVVKPGQLEAFEIVIPAATLTSPKEGLDKNMQKALKVQEFPDITFRLLRTIAGTNGALNAVGVLKIAGVEREVTLTLKTERQDAGLLVKGELGLLMTDFNIKPPVAMLGMSTV